MHASGSRVEMRSCGLGLSQWNATTSHTAEEVREKERRIGASFRRGKDYDSSPEFFHVGMGAREPILVVLVM